MGFALIGPLEKRGWRHLASFSTLLLRPFHHRGNVTAVVEGNRVQKGFRLRRCFFVSGTERVAPDLAQALPLSELDPVAISETIRDLAIVTRKGFTYD